MLLFREFSLDIKKEIRSAFLKIYGVGWYKAYLLTIKSGISYPCSLSGINSYMFSIICFLLKGFVVGDARIKRAIYSNINLKVELNSYQGARHKYNLPYMVSVLVLMHVLNVFYVLILSYWILVLKDN